MNKADQIAGEWLSSFSEVDLHHRDRDFRTFEGKLVVRYECEHHGFAGWNLPCTPVCCRVCGQPLFPSVVDLIFADLDTIKPLDIG